MLYAEKTDLSVAFAETDPDDQAYRICEAFRAMVELGIGSCRDEARPPAMQWEAGDFGWCPTAGGYYANSQETAAHPADAILLAAEKLKGEKA